MGVQTYFIWDVDEDLLPETCSPGWQVFHSVESFKNKKRIQLPPVRLLCSCNVLQGWAMHAQHEINYAISGQLKPGQNWRRQCASWFIIGFALLSMGLEWVSCKPNDTRHSTHVRVEIDRFKAIAVAMYVQQCRILSPRCRPPCVPLAPWPRVRGAALQNPNGRSANFLIIIIIIISFWAQRPRSV